MNFTINRSDFQPQQRINTLTIDMWWVITISNSTKYQRLLFLRSSQRVIHLSKQIIGSINSIKTTTTEMNFNENYSA